MAGVKQPFRFHNYPLSNSSLSPLIALLQESGTEGKPFRPNKPIQEGVREGGHCLAANRIFRRAKTLWLQWWYQGGLLQPREHRSSKGPNRNYLAFQPNKDIFSHGILEALKKTLMLCTNYSGNLANDGNNLCWQQMRNLQPNSTANRIAVSKALWYNFYSFFMNQKGLNIYFAVTFLIKEVTKHSFIVLVYKGIELKYMSQCVGNNNSTGHLSMHS